MTINEKPQIVSRDYESDLDQLKRIYADNKKVDQSVIDFANQNLAAHEVTVVAYVTGTAGGEHAK